MPIADQLRSVRTRLEDPEHWTTNAWARDAQGRVVNEDSEDASSWCLVGAVSLEPYNAAASAYKFLSRFTFAKYGLTPIIFNDTVTHKEILEALDGAIALAEEQEKNN